MNNPAPIIPRTTIGTHVENWQQALSNAITEPAVLLKMLNLPTSTLDARTDTGFPLKVPPGFVRRMKKGDPHDPLLLQVLATGAELTPAEDFSDDPLGETNAISTPGLLHKYIGRALLTITGACAIHCRYCFRRHFPYADNNPSGQHWDEALEYLRKHDDIEEIILSGGDPLSLTDRKLATLVHQLDEIPHLRTLRIHTRTAVVVPERITESLCKLVQSSRFRIVVVTHVNHANEIDETVQQAMDSLRNSGALLLNQSVLLKGINDNEDVLAALSHKLLSAGILPYYLHQLDKVQGAAHFEVSDQRASTIMKALHEQLPGYLVPRLCREETGKEGKTLLWPGTASSTCATE